MRAPERLGPYVYRQSDTCFPLGGDSLALAAFASVRRGDRVCDLGCGAGALLLLFTHLAAPVWFFPLFHLSPRACAIATMMMTVQGLLMPVRDFNHCTIVGVLRGGGDVQAASLIDLGPLWLVAIPLAALAGVVLRLDILWVYLAMSGESLVKSFIGMWRLRSGKWIHDLTQINAIGE